MERLLIKNIFKQIKFYCLIVSFGIMIAFGCSRSVTKHSDNASADRKTDSRIEILKDSLESIAKQYPGEIGVALLTDNGDTITVNNDNKYPLMSVFKLHQAISLCHLFEQRGTSLDSIVEINRNKLNPDTWSPMLKDYNDDRIKISVRELMRYTLMQSDNNASNYMFENIENVDATDSFISTVIPRESFRLAVTESEMWANHSRCYENHSSPLGAALLINRLFSDSILSQDNRDFICTALRECKTGTDRIVAPLADKDGVIAAHKTGSGFRNNEGILSAHNDVGFISLPNGRNYTLAVLVKDFNGPETRAAEAIAHISATVYSQINEFYSASGD